ncbi:hypothetical protein M9435_002322 [Picochlorum sp. BPE23]|nr:hypothetical protein M9435_002322 [Picochlorum sp. BPE23]
MVNKGKRVGSIAGAKKQKKKFKRAVEKAQADELDIRKDDVFEADTVDADEDVHAYRYDDVDNYEYELPEDFEDEEIDEDEAFNSEDEQLYGHLFSRKKYSESEGSESEEEPSEGHAAFDALASDDEEWPEEEDWDDAGRQSFHLGEHNLDTADIGRRKDESDGDVIHDDEDGASMGGDSSSDEGLVTEAYPESVFAMSNKEGEKLSVDDLIASLGSSRAKLGVARKSLDRLGKKAVPLDAPLPGPIQARQERKAAYDESKKDIQKWMPLVKAHREAPTLKFSSDKNLVTNTVSVAGIASKHQPETKMESEVAALLNAANAETAGAVAESEDALAMRMLNAEEAKARRDELAKMRALLFYHEVKAKRLKKIKSKEYRRRMKKADKKKMETGGQDMLVGEEELQAQREEAEYERAKERLTLKHKNTSRFIRRAIKRGSQHAPDEGTRAVISEQLRLGEEIRRKVNALPSGKDSSSDSSDDDDGESSDDDRREERASRKIQAAAREILDDDGNHGEQQEKGLLSLPFMKRAMEKKREEAKKQAQQIVDVPDRNATVNGRKSFGAAAAGGNKLGGDDLDHVRAELLESSDEEEDAEAKHARLTKNVGSGRLDKTEQESADRIEVSMDQLPDMPPPKRRPTQVSVAGITIKNPSEKSKVAEKDTTKTFVASKKFKGHREGYVFTNGSRGVGYYKDEEASSGQHATAKKSHVQKPLARSGDPKAMSTQRELISKAFAGDDVVKEFKDSKQEEVEGELPQEEVPGQLPGWGTWASQTKEPKWVQEAKAKAEAKKKAAARSRRDANMDYVVISEKWDVKSSKYKTQRVPYPFDSKETYERSMRQPLGKEFNTVESFRNLTRPSVVKDNGVIIQPLKYSEKVARHKDANPSRAHGIMSVAGGMAQRSKK